ncbi:MAG: cupredoxin domain-containing protein [Actinobacteria bacterium]|nr:cupredoxin domain-containing protein [Actinomycetota bacterium]
MKWRLVLVMAVAALAGCGGDEGDDSAAPGGSELEIVENEFALDPADVSVDAAGETTIRVVNNGEFPHALEVEGEGVEEETGSLAPGESAELTVELEEGEYELYCPIGNHREQGMEGTLVVGAGATGGAGTDETETTQEGGYDGP